jgi:hypothetical protein
VLVRTGLSAALAGVETAMLEKLTPVKLKHLSAHPAMDAQSSADFCVLSLGALWWWWSQSGIASTAAMAALAAGNPAARPVAAGSEATDRATRAVKMVRPIRMVPLYPSEPQTTKQRIQRISMAANSMLTL